MYILLILLIPMLWPIAAKIIWHNEITWGEMSANMAATAVITLGVYYAGAYASLSDTATINGQVVAKTSDRVSCRHSYPCNCRTTSCGKGCSTTTCDTCYEHGFDIDWDVHANVGRITVDTVDRQGLKEPPRWTKTVIGEPFATTTSYQNYIKAAPDSLFNQLKATKYLDRVPEYPQSIYDYYRVDRFVAVGVPVPDVKDWNEGISNILRKLGPAKQSNIVMVVTKEPREFADAVAYKWLGGKKNDVVVVVGVSTYPEISWVQVLTWSKFSIFEVKLRDLLLEHKTLAAAQTLKDLDETVTKYYTRKPMEEFKYLEDEFDPPSRVFDVTVIEKFDKTLEQCLSEVETLTNFEGWCLRDVSTGFYCKLKTDWYRRNHRAQTELRERDVADMVIDETIDDIKSALALDNFDLTDILRIEQQVVSEVIGLRGTVDDIIAGIEDKTNFKEIAIKFKTHPMFGLIMTAVRGGEADFKKFWINNYRDGYSLRCVYNKNF